MLVTLKNGIYRDKKNPRVEAFKKELGLTGDVFIVDHYIYSLKSYKDLFYESTVKNIVDAYQEYLTKYKGKEAEYGIQEQSSEDIS